MAMDPQPTAIRPPLHVTIADDVRIKIEKGELAPGDPLPTLAELAAEWSCSSTTARAAVALLRTQGLITVGRGKAPTVRIPPRRVVRDSARHQAEKDRALASEAERRAHGEAEDDLGLPLGATDFRPDYRFVPASEQLARVFSVPPGTDLLRKTYETRDRTGWTRLAYSVSYVPVALLESQPELLHESCEPWAGGHQHQFRVVGIEIGQIVDEVRAVMPTTVDVQRWGLEDGVPLMIVRRISTDTAGRVVEVSDATYPADRTLLRFRTPLKPWSE